jgi:hypothetical protein
VRTAIDLSVFGLAAAAGGASFSVVELQEAPRRTPSTRCRNVRTLFAVARCNLTPRLA